jgi:hypothetical protein
MRESAMLFEPIVNIRDVLESFLVDRVVLGDWRGTLASASARLVELGRAWSDNDLLELGHVTKHLAAESLLADSALARTAATMPRGRSIRCVSPACPIPTLESPVAIAKLHRPDGRDACYLARAGCTKGSGSLLRCRSGGVHVVDDQYALSGNIVGTTKLAAEGFSTNRKLKAPYWGAKFRW